MLGLLQNAVRLALIKPEFHILMLPEATDLFLGSCVTQVQK